MLHCGIKSDFGLKYFWYNLSGKKGIFPTVSIVRKTTFICGSIYVTFSVSKLESVCVCVCEREREREREREKLVVVCEKFVLRYFTQLDIL